MDRWRWPAQGPQCEGSAGVRYELPALFGADDFPSIENWRHRRRRLLEGLAEHVYGYTPADGSLASVTLLSRQPVLESRGTMTEWLMTVAGPRRSMDVPLLVVQPADSVAASGSPVFLGMNILENHALTSLPWLVRKIVGGNRPSGQTCGHRRTSPGRRGAPGTIVLAKEPVCPGRLGHNPPPAGPWPATRTCRGETCAPTPPGGDPHGFQVPCTVILRIMPC